jgi:DNA-binding NarL/FixJ family response regulator
MRLIVIDDHPLILEAMRWLLRGLQAQADIATAADCESGLALAERGPLPDLVLLDMQLPGLGGMSAVRAWRSRWPMVPLVVLSASRDARTVTEVLNAGAAGFIPKSTSNEVMLAALRLVLDGGRYLPPLLLDAGDSVQRAPSAVQSLALTERQLQVLRLLAQGAPNKVIGRELGLAERTVKAHVTAVLRTLKVSNRTHVAIAAARLGLGGAGS